MEKMKDEKWQRRQFLLSSFIRMKIPLKNQVYRCIDKLLSSNWKSSHQDLNDVDEEIKKIYEDFLNE